MKRLTYPCGRALIVLIKMLAVILCAVCAGAILMYAVYCLPTDSMNRHLLESAAVFEEEGSYPRYLSWCSSTLDNFTDALMLLTAAYDGEQPAMEKAMSLYYELTPELGTVESLVLHGKSGTATVEYARYWEGYLIFLKPLLALMNYRQLRLLNRIAQLAAAVLLLWLMKRKGYAPYILPMLLTWALLPFPATSQSLTCSDVFYISVFGSCVLLLRRERWQGTQRPLFFFLGMGILTSFFDFLTYPLVSFGIPVCLYFCGEQKPAFVPAMKKFVLFGASWSLGYVGMWAGKWVTASLLTGQDVIQNAIYSVQFRSGTVLAEGDTIRLSDVYLRNLGEWARSPFFLLFWLFCVAAVVLLLKKDRFSHLRENLIFLPVACLPLAWYLMARNHSYIHFFFTFKELTIFAFALMCFFTKSLWEALRAEREAQT